MHFQTLMHLASVGRVRNLHAVSLEISGDQFVRVMVVVVCDEMRTYPPLLLPPTPTLPRPTLRCGAQRRNLFLELAVNVTCSAG